MHNTTRARHALTPAIPADKLALAIKALEDRLRDSQRQAETETKNDTSRFYYLGRADAFEVALYQLREVAQ